MSNGEFAMIQGPILDPLRQIKTNDLQVLGARIREGSELQKGQIATIEVAFFLSREVESFASRLRIYKTDGHCIFASSLKNNGPLVNSYYRADFYVIAGLPPGQYVASFEFQDNSLSEADGFDVKKILALHNLYVQFGVNTNADVPQGLEDSVVGYISVPFEVAVNRQMLDGSISQNSIIDESVSYFPWPLVENNSIKIEYIIQKLHTKILGLEPVGDSLEKLVAICSDHQRGIEFVLDELLSDDRSWIESIKNNAGKLIDSVYLAILNRRPEFNTVNLKKDLNVTSYLRSVVNSPEFLALSASRSVFKKFENFSRNAQDGGHLQIDGDCVLVHTPLDGIFAYCALACCRLIRRDYPDKKIYLISDVALQAEDFESEKNSLYIDGIFRTTDVINNGVDLVLRPGLIISFSETAMDNVIALMQLYPQALFGVMSDGFRNVATAIRWAPHAKVRVVYFFGFKGALISKDYLIEKIIPLPFLWQVQKILLNKKWGCIFELEIDKYSVFYPRYWWRAPYGLECELIVLSWIRTVLENSSEDELIVIKSSPLYGDDAGVISNFRDKLAELGRFVLYAEEFCESLGLDKEMANLPSEDLFYLGVFDKARRHYVLDGSLATIVASHPSVKRPFQLVLGSHMEVMNNYMPSMMIGNLSIQMEGLMNLSNFTLVSDVNVGDGKFPAIIEFA